MESRSEDPRLAALPHIDLPATEDLEFMADLPGDPSIVLTLGWEFPHSPDYEQGGTKLEVFAGQNVPPITKWQAAAMLQTVVNTWVAEIEAARWDGEMP